MTTISKNSNDYNQGGGGRNYSTSPDMNRIPTHLRKRAHMEISRIIETNPALTEAIQSIGIKLLGTPEERTQINKSYLAIYLLNIIILHESRLLKAYKRVGKENVLIALYNTETFLEDLEINFLELNYKKIMQDLANFLTNLSARSLNSKIKPY